MRLSKQDYSIALTNPLWKDKRFRVLKRDEYKCRKCGSERDLHVHHVIFNIIQYIHVTCNGET